MYHGTKFEFSGYLNFIRYQNENLSRGHEIISKALKRYRICDFLKIESRTKYASIIDVYKMISIIINAHSTKIEKLFNIIGKYRIYVNK